MKIEVNLGFLTIVFITLKLCHVIDWNWFWVLSPLVLPFALDLVVGLGINFFRDLKSLGWKPAIGESVRSKSSGNTGKITNIYENGVLRVDFHNTNARTSIPMTIKDVWKE